MNKNYNSLVKYFILLTIAPCLYFLTKNAFQNKELLKISSQVISKKEARKNIELTPKIKKQEKRNELNSLFATIPRKGDISTKNLEQTSLEVLEFATYYNKVKKRHSYSQLQLFLKKCFNDKTILNSISSFCAKKIIKEKK